MTLQELKRRVLNFEFEGDRALWVIVAILCVISMLVIYSSTASMAYRVADGDTLHYLFRQLFSLIIGLGMMYVIHKIDYKYYAILAWPIFIFAGALMLATFFFGRNLNDAARWLTIPIIGGTFQPSDFLRVSMVLLLARQLSVRQGDVTEIKLLPPLLLDLRAWREDRESCMDIVINNTIPLLGPIFFTCGTIFISNFSTAAMTFFTCMVILYLGRINVREIFRLVINIAVCVISLVGVMFVAGVGRASVWVHRITDLFSSSEPHFQVKQAMIAVASGGLFGKGPGRSTQRANLPHSYSDFAYAFIIEEYGMIFATFVLMVYMMILFRAVKILKRCETSSSFPSLLVLGLGTMIVMQAMVNMMVSVGLGPVTGQTLPIISLGGTSIVFTSMAFGMMLGVSREIKDSVK